MLMKEWVLSPNLVRMISWEDKVDPHLTSPRHLSKPGGDRSCTFHQRSPEDARHHNLVFCRWTSPYKLQFGLALTAHQRDKPSHMYFCVIAANGPFNVLLLAMIIFFVLSLLPLPTWHDVTWYEWLKTSHYIILSPRLFLRSDTMRQREETCFICRYWWHQKLWLST